MSSKVCYDHLGNRYNSIKDMCKHYNIGVDAFASRIRAKWTLKDALTNEINHDKQGKAYCDHLGNEYSSFISMCRHYNKSKSLVKERLKSGWSLEDALTKDRIDLRKECQDHLGIKYKSINDMCSKYGISEATFKSRIKVGWSLEDALTIGINGKKKCYDHLNNCYNSIKDMCNNYNISVPTFKHRLEDGWSIEDALTIRSSGCRGESIEYKGTVYKSFSELCKDYNILSVTAKSRLRDGWTLEDAIEIPASESYSVTDHKGNKYKGFVHMCNTYNMAATTVKKRLEDGWTLKDALETPTKLELRVRDHKGNEYRTFTDMCNAYMISPNTVRGRINSGWTLKNALEGKPKILDGLGNEFDSLPKLINYYKVNKANKVKDVTIYKRIREGFDLIIAVTGEQQIQIKFIGLDNKSYYSVPWSNAYVTAREIIQHYRPDLIDLYDKYNPTGEYNPYRG